MSPSVLIELDNQAAIFCAGQVVSGRIVVEVKGQSETCQGLKVQIQGYCQVQVQYTTSQYDSDGINRKITHTERDGRFFLSNEMYLLGNDANKTNSITIPIGRTEYPFNILLPQNIPSSFRGKKGFIQYDLIGVIKKSWKFDVGTRVSLRIFAILDLNTCANSRFLQSPLSSTVTIKVDGCYFCCPSGPVSLKCQLPKIGYVSGEWIEPVIEICNMSKKKIKDVVMQLVYVVFYIAKTHQNTGLENGLEIRWPLVGIDPKKTEIWRPRLQVPISPPSTPVQEVNMINFRYKLKITARIEGFLEKKARWETEITIGTVPFH